MLKEFNTLITLFEPSFNFINVVKEALPLFNINDVSHDSLHIYRVLQNAYDIWCRLEKKGDPDIIIAAVLFHDAVVYPKDHPKSKDSTADSVKEAEKILIAHGFSKDKLMKVKDIVLHCSFSRNIRLPLIESDIVQDADMLESVGLISIMRTYASAGDMKKQFYNSQDPLAKHRKLDPMNNAYDLIPARLEVVVDRLRTEASKDIAKETGRLEFLDLFKRQLARELKLF